MEAEVKTVTICVETEDQVTVRALAAFRGEKQGSFISFSSDESLWRALSAARWKLIKAMAGQGAMSIRQAARLDGRNIRVVHADVQILLKAGVLQHANDGGIIFPYDAIHLELHARAGEKPVRPRLGSRVKRLREERRAA